MIDVPKDSRYAKQRDALARFAPLSMKQLLLGLLAEAGMLKAVAAVLGVNTNTLSRWLANEGLRVAFGKVFGIQTGKPLRATKKAREVVRAALEVSNDGN